ncbi:hypothetical protein ACO1O0_004998 [Amphichorda felina]
MIRQRGNTPSDVANDILHPQLPQELRDRTLWIMDRILEPQTIARFMMFAADGQLPDSQQASPSQGTLDFEDLLLLQQPLSSWAPPPYNQNDEIPMNRIMARIGSFEDASRLVPISKELHAMKSRLWEGVMPLSERRWNDLHLDDPDNFSTACQYFCGVINVFHYLNLADIKSNLRDTYNLIWDHLKTFEDALNAKKTAQGQPTVNITGLWYAFIRELYDSISNRAHHWVITHIDRLRDPILAQLASLPEPGPRQEHLTQEHWTLTNRLHDLSQNTAQADFAIFIPTDGYKGGDIPSQDNAPPPSNSPYREEPISFSANTRTRQADYYTRIKYLSRVELWSNFNENAGATPVPQDFHGVTDLASVASSQARAQARARIELHGEPRIPEQETWIAEANRRLEMPTNSYESKYLAYRLCHDHTDEEWETFKTKFEADVSNWGGELSGADNVKANSVVEWRYVKDFGFEDGNMNVEGVKTHFNSLRQFNLVPPQAHSNVILTADKAVIDSYLNPTPGQGGFILAIDTDFDSNDVDSSRSDESPGYNGTLRILGSLLWDDVSALMLMQTQYLEELWPLAMNHPRQVYEGPAIERITV